MKYSFRGFMAPVFTAFTESMEVNYDIIPKYAEYLQKRGVNGVLINGTTGEGVSLNIDERKRVTQEWSWAVKTTKQSLMVQIGGTSMTNVIELAKHAESQNADALLCLPELFFKPKRCQDLVDYLKLVAKAAPNTPLLYYHIPSFTDVNLDMESFIEMACEEIPTFAGIKFTHTNLEEGARCVQIGKEKDVAIFLGADQLLSAATILGFDSAIATTLNMWPELLIDIQRNVNNGNTDKAMALQEKLTKRINQIIKHGSWVPTMKAVMNLSSEFDMGKPRPPLVPLTKLQIQTIATIFSK
ncbi:hypothetical protein O3M35_009432 [Rhynocoris fuscipes]|uniref:N-acetylneuraminate lyase n=1 Tax=Rhynocoris fuscipes TaxID=488301 RepID=A0AAW1D4A9_9HEMI